MTQKHTPGPWFAVRNSAYWQINPQRDYGDDHIPYTVADCCASDPGDTTGLQEANARLIAAAPDLLEALEDCVDAMTRFGIQGGNIGVARRVIAKAKGEAQ